MSIFGFDLEKALIPDVNVVETVIRGVVMYGVIYSLLRVLLRGRTTGMTTSDLLVLVLIADAAQNAMAAEYHSLASGVILVATIVGTSSLIDWLAYRVPALQRYVHPPHKPLVVNGRIIRRTLEEEFMTEEELMTQLRLAGIEKVADVKAAYLEGNGEVSVIERKGSDVKRRSR
jgi:uncharacterized membrane protein YcaP (DUF421 family)